MRIVLDTNQLVRALMRPPELATFLMAWEAKRFSVICSPALLDEYERVLAHPDVAKLIFPELLRTFRSHLLYDIEIVNVPDLAPIARDPDDDKLIAAAIFGLADFLVTEDQDLQAPAVVETLRSAGVGVIATTDLIKMLD